MEQISYERRVYESEDDESLPKDISQNFTGIRFKAVVG